MKMNLDDPKGAARVEFILRQYIGAKYLYEQQNKKALSGVMNCPAWIWGDWCNQIETWLLFLPVAYCDMLRKIYCDGVSVEDYAKMNGETVSHVRNKLHLAFMMLDEKGFMSSSSIFFDDDEIAWG